MHLHEKENFIKIKFLAFEICFSIFSVSNQKISMRE